MTKVIFKNYRDIVLEQDERYSEFKADLAKDLFKYNNFLVEKENQIIILGLQTIVEKPHDYRIFGVFLDNELKLNIEDSLDPAGNLEDNSAVFVLLNICTEEFNSSNISFNQHILSI